MAKIVSSYDPDILEIKKGGGLISCIGLIFFIPFLGVMAALLDPSFRNEPAGVVMTCIFAGMFGIAALTMVFGRAGIIFNRHLKTINTWWGLVIPFHQTQYSWKDFTHVTITKEIRRSKNSTYTVYVGRLVGQTPVSLGEDQEYLKTLQIAEASASFLGIYLADASTGLEVIRQPNELNESLRDRLRRTGKIREFGELPAKSKIRQRIEGTDITVFLPKMGWSCSSIFILILGLGIMGFFDTVFFVILQDKSIGIPKDMIPFIFIFTSLPGFFVCLFSLRLTRIKTTIHLSRESLQIKTIGLFWSSTKEIPLAQLEELKMITQSFGHSGQSFFYSPYLMARSDYIILQFGQGLSKEELDWLFALLENAIAA